MTDLICRAEDTVADIRQVRLLVAQDVTSVPLCFAQTAAVNAWAETSSDAAKKHRLMKKER